MVGEGREEVGWEGRGVTTVLTDYTWKTQISVSTQPGHDSMTLPVVIVYIEMA